MTSHYGARAQRGFTLVEMMVVVLIIAVLAAVGYPSYTDYVTRSNRQAARAMILALADRQEQFFLDNKRYAEDLTELGYADAVIGIGRDGQEVDSDDESVIYILQIADGGGTEYTIQAAPLNAQAANDTSCAVLSTNERSERIASGGGDRCW